MGLGPLVLSANIFSFTLEIPKNSDTLDSFCYYIHIIKKISPTKEINTGAILTEPIPSISVKSEATTLFSTSFWAPSLLGQSASSSSIKIIDGCLKIKK